MEKISMAISVNYRVLEFAFVPVVIQLWFFSRWSEKHRRGSSMGHFSIVAPSLCFRTHADSPITHYIRVDVPIRTNLRNMFISVEKFVLMRGVLFVSFVIEMAATLIIEWR